LLFYGHAVSIDVLTIEETESTGYLFAVWIAEHDDRGDMVRGAGSYRKACWRRIGIGN
jgi:hypothetical protein